MLNFPLPYHDELIYSTVARAKVRAGMLSPKAFLDDIFEDRKVVATIDLPCHLKKIEAQFNSKQLNATQLIYQHTLFPLYAPFVTEDRRKQCINWMLYSSQGSIHLSLGINASRLPPLNKLRYCPQCVIEQQQQFGEFYWSRLWQVNGANYCLRHGCELVDSEIDLRPIKRHQFIDANPENCSKIIAVDKSYSEDDIFITKKIHELLKLPEQPSFSHAQWTAFYKNLAQINHCNKGTHHVDFPTIIRKVKSRWSTNTLKQYQLHMLDTETSWLKSIFRKHRKCFSYLEHILVIEAMTDKDWLFSELFKKIQNISADNRVKVHSKKKKIDDNLISFHRNKWENALQHYQGSIQITRKNNASLYAWLYRNDKKWLLAFNKKRHHYHVPDSLQANWQERDMQFVRQLIKLNHSLIWDLYSPRRTKKWWIQQLTNVSTIEKNMMKLPLTAMFLNRYCEDVTDYQIRRVMKVLIDMYEKKHTLAYWQVLRIAGLSKERITNKTARFMNKAYELSVNKIQETEL